MYLEMILPTRGTRASARPDRQAIEKITDNDPLLEDEIVRRLIAQGKIKRASVNWCSVLLKWSIINILTAYVYHWTYYLIDVALFKMPIRDLWAFRHFFILLADSITGSLALHSLACLVSILAVEPKHRALCTAFASLMSYALIAAFVHWNLAWIMKTTFVKVILENMQKQHNGTSATFNMELSADAKH